MPLLKGTILYDFVASFKHAFSPGGESIGERHVAEFEAAVEGKLTDVEEDRVVETVAC